MSIPDFENLRQIITYFQYISIPEHFYLERWPIYFTALKEISAVAFIMYGIFFVLKSFIFKYTYGLNGLRRFTWEVSRFLFHYLIIFLIFGALLLVLGLSVPDKNMVSSFWSVFGLLGCVFGLLSLSRDYNRFLGILCIICFSICGSFYALSSAYSSDSNVFYGHISADMDSEYKIDYPASISVKIGGPDSGLSVFLLHDDPDGLKPISSLCLYSNNSSTQFNDTLIGYSQGPGNYIISLNNTTSLPSGHYRLVFENPKYKWINLSSPFFLSPK
ncbi:MAG: hypothetical protein AB9861_02685 [Methanosarcina sp.]